MDITNFKTIKEVESYRSKINEDCDKRIKQIKNIIRANELSEKPFMYIKESFEAISPELFKTNDGKSLLKRYISTVRGSKNLSSLFNLFEAIRKSNKNSDIDYCINSIASGNWNIDKKSIDEDSKKIGTILAEGYLMLGEKAEELLPKENVELSKAAKYISENRKSNKNIAEYSKAVKVIKEHISNNETEDKIFENVDVDKFANSMINEFNKKYSDLLTLDEQKALKDICEAENKEDVFNSYKSKCIGKISEAKSSFESKGETSSVQRMDAILEKVSSKKYSLDTLGSDVCNMIEISNLL